jgi:hypothetical protein
LFCDFARVLNTAEFHVFRSTNAPTGSVHAHDSACQAATLPPLPLGVIASVLQVLWTYGDRSSEDFFAYHGFVLPDNPQEEAQLWGGVGELVAWFCRERSAEDAGGRLLAAAGAALIPLQTVGLCRLMRYNWPCSLLPCLPRV